MGRKIIFDWAAVEENRHPTTSRKRLAVIVLAAMTISALMVLAFWEKPSVEQPDHLGDTGKTVGVPETGRPSNADTSSNQSGAESTIVQNGVTVVTPKLLVPAVSADASGTADAATSPTAKTHPTHKYARSRVVAGGSHAPWFNPVRGNGLSVAKP